MKTLGTRLVMRYEQKLKAWEVIKITGKTNRTNPFIITAQSVSELNHEIFWVPDIELYSLKSKFGIHLIALQDGS